MAKVVFGAANQLRR